MSKEKAFLRQIRRAQKPSLKKYILKFKKELDKYFRKQLKAYLKELKDQNIEIIDQKKIKIQKIDIDIPEAERLLTKVWTKLLFTASIKAMADLLDEVKVDLSFWIDDLYALEFAKERAWSMITKVNNTTKKEINWILNTWLKSGKDYPTLAKQIRKKFVWFSKFRSELIASNELKSAYEQWKLAQGKDFEKRSWADMYKKWVTQWDNRVTDECKNDSGVWWIPIDEDFPTGHERPPRFPWCRCGLEYLSWEVLKV